MYMNVEENKLMWMAGCAKAEVRKKKDGLW